mmetsp:Transcript_27647/g.44326  ORF Transcript_27647/g.44326 Transcript_27647/m.44326 type:complete len:364 (-) Transcript_27647:539-1630(-)
MSAMPVASCSTSLRGARAAAVPRARGRNVRVACTTAGQADRRTEEERCVRAVNNPSLLVTLRRSATAAVAAVVVAANPGAAFADQMVVCAPEGSAINGVYAPPAPTNGPLKSLPRELTEPDEIFGEDFNVKFMGSVVDHKLLLGALILGQGVGFMGSVVGGNEARKKGEQIKTLNSSLIKVNAELRREMRNAGLGPYVPIPAQRFIEKLDGTSTDEDDQVVASVLFQLKRAKGLLKTNDNADALKEFKAALSEIEGNPLSLAQGWKAARKAHRGMGAALERMGRYPEALVSMKTVLSLSTEHDDHAGETDALGVIADIYTDMDKLEEAAEYYDRFFNSLQEEDAKTQADSDAARSALMTPAAM